MYIQTNIRFNKTLPSGKVARVTEAYLVEADTFTEAEERIVRERTPYISGDYSVVAAKKSRIAEVDADRRTDIFWLAKVAFVSIDEKTAAESKHIHQILVDAPCFDEAVAELKDFMAGTLSDWSLESLSLTNIMGVYR